ncbi:subtilisin-like protease SBT3.18 [Gastrolobium bilobum]|uniref:subtilisin-like protease SBT3.18 n=1 Tax=Gastrolobium bilobum TaxID=150636 RepID=UPI002AB0991B|nr:subtilisin-like protease SBT3.18 [Gastrolobium bilobum]
MAAYFQCFWGLFLSRSIYFVQSTSAPQVYIVYLGLNHISDPGLTFRYHLQLLSTVFTCEKDAERSILYSYKYGLSGFSAMLNPTQAATLANMQEVVSVFRSQSSQSHTTRSWDFLDLTLDNSEVTPLQLIYGEDIIVGVFDTGVWPESESFEEDPSIGPIPSTWKGECVEGERFDPATACSNKLIGARYYLKGFEQEYGPLNTTENFEYQSPRDFVGHGTHTASTAVGSVVEDASFFDLGKGTARGGAPRARLAVYKVCWNIEYYGRCSEADIMAAFDDALHDGVHIISASFGPIPPLAPFFKDSSSIGSFHAMQLGVTVVFSAGNYDVSPEPYLVGNVEPWSICVAASSVDRIFPTKIIIGDNLYTGESLITTQIKAKLADASTYFYNGICKIDYIKPSKSGAGRIVLCFSTIGPTLSLEAATAAKAVNATGLIFVEPMSRQLPDIDVVPTVLVNLEEGTKIKYFLAESPRLPKVQIEPSKTVIGKAPAPTIAYFSSRGPSSITPDILKPDISAPGVNILAAWPPETPPSSSSSDGRSVRWNFQSGTSMACPHVAGVAALIKSAHPNWSPAAIRSALMTTANTLDTTMDSILAGGSMKVADNFDMGAGNLDPTKAVDPGLVYDIKSTDYIIFLCNMGFTREKINKIISLPSPDPVETSCKHLVAKTNAILNYPSITISNLKSTITMKRTVRNVGRNKNVIYFVSIIEPCGVEVVIWPKILIFSWFKQENSYYLTLKPIKKSQGRYDFGEIVWSDGFHYVRSPLSVRINNTSGSGSGSGSDGSN